MAEKRQDTRKTWGIPRFPVDLRNRFGALARRRGQTMLRALEELIARAVDEDEAKSSYSNRSNGSR